VVKHAGWNGSVSIASPRASEPVCVLQSTVNFQTSNLSLPVQPNLLEIGRTKMAGEPLGGGAFPSVSAGRIPPRVV
jgi:hypothetical protein